MALTAKVVPDVTLVSASSKSLQEHQLHCKNPGACSQRSWASKGAFWRSKFPWLRAGYAGKTTALTLGCQVCALHATKFSTAGNENAQLSAYATFSVQPDATWKTWRFKHTQGTTLLRGRAIPIVMLLAPMNGKTSCAS